MKLIVARRDSRIVPNEVRRNWTEQVTRLNSKTKYGMQNARLYTGRLQNGKKLLEA